MIQEKDLVKNHSQKRPLINSTGSVRAPENSCCGNEAFIGKRLRSLRHERRLTIRVLAGKCGISVNTLSLIENNRTSPSVHTLNRLATGLEIPLATFFEEEKYEQDLVYQQNGRRELISFPHGTLEQLGKGLPPLGAEPILVTLDTDHKNIGEITHTGREFIFCLDGKVTCVVADKSYMLSPGDSLLFDASAPHRWANSFSAPSKLLVLFCPMEGHDQPAERHLDH